MVVLAFWSGDLGQLDDGLDGFPLCEEEALGGSLAGWPRPGLEQAPGRFGRSLLVCAAPCRHVLAELIHDLEVPGVEVGLRGFSPPAERHRSAWCAPFGDAAAARLR